MGSSKKQCEICGKEHNRYKHCSTKCSGKAYYMRTKNQKMLRVKIWKKNNKEKVKEYKRKHYLNNWNYIKEKSKEWRKNNPTSDLRRCKENKHYLKKVIARSKAKQIPLLNKKCKICESKIRLERHHYNYDKPLKVKILCTDCHIKEHGGFGIVIP